MGDGLVSSFHAYMCRNLGHLVDSRRQDISWYGLFDLAILIVLCTLACICKAIDGAHELHASTRSRRVTNLYAHTYIHVGVMHRISAIEP